MVYPTSLYRKISNCISPKWRLRIKTYVEIFHSSFKDGINGTQDYRSLSRWLIFLSGCFPPILFATVIFITDDIFIASSITAIFFYAMAFLCMLVQPYKERLQNTLTSGLLLVIGFVALVGTHKLAETGPTGENEFSRIL